MDFLRKYVLHNFGLKLLSLVVAVLLWMAVTRDPMAEVALNVPIEFHNSPEHLEISVETAITDPVDASGVVGTATFLTHAYVSDPLVRLTDSSPIRVTVVTEKQRK